MIVYSDVVADKPKLFRHCLIFFISALIPAIISFFYFDQAISQYFNAERLMAYRRLARTLTDIGLSENFFILTTVMFVIAHWFERRAQLRERIPMIQTWKWLKRWAANFFLALIFSGVIIHIFKALIGRQRPHVSDTFEPYVFSSFEFNSYFQSMPSGHSQVVFCVATMASFMWPRIWWLMYLIAFGLAFTRVVVHAHFLSDILMGAAVGHIGTLWYLRLMEKRFPGRLSLIR